MAPTKTAGAKRKALAAASAQDAATGAPPAKKSRPYLELPAVDMKTDLLEWWAENEINFPALSVMARQYLGVPATSASSERLFSLAGRAFDDQRQCMKEEMLEMLMWARVNREKRWENRA